MLGWLRRLGGAEKAANSSPVAVAAAVEERGGDDGSGIGISALRTLSIRALLDAAQAAANADTASSTADILDNAIGHIQTAFGARHACVHFVREEALTGATAMHGMASCPVGHSPRDLQPHLASVERAAMEQALRLGHPVRMSDAIGGFAELGAAAGFEDGIVVPIAYQGDTFAWVNVYVPATYPFDDLDQGLLRTVGGVLYGAIKKEAFVNALQRIRATLETHFSPRVVDKLIGDPEKFRRAPQDRATGSHRALLRHSGVYRAV